MAIANHAQSIEWTRARITRTLARFALGAWLVCVPAALPTAQAPVTAAPTVKSWVGQEQRMELHLKQATVTTIEDIGTGVTRPRRAHLEPAEPFESLVWKVLPAGRRNGYWESDKSEIAAYELDKLLQMHMVPPAVERDIKGETGAAIMWLGGVRSVAESGGKVPSGPQWNAPIRRMQMFDNLIANKDRNAGNILIGGDGELILIDHSRAFIDDEDIQTFERVDAELWTRMAALSRDDATRALGGWLDRRAIAAMIARRDRMRKAVDQLIARHGRASVLIP